MRFTEDSSKKESITPRIVWGWWPPPLTEPSKTPWATPRRRLWLCSYAPRASDAVLERPSVMASGPVEIASRDIWRLTSARSKICYVCREFHMLFVFCRSVAIRFGRRECRGGGGVIFLGHQQVKVKEGSGSAPCLSLTGLVRKSFRWWIHLMQHIVCLYANLSGMIPSHVAFDHIYWKILLLFFSIQSGLTWQ